MRGVVKSSYFVGITCIMLSLIGSIESDCSRCAECIGTSGLCASCPPGYWGYMCDRECSVLNCRDNICSQFSGSCICKKGYFGMPVSRGYQCIQCPENCAECSDFEECLSCIDGKYGDKCDLDCSPGCAKCTAVVHGSDSDKCLECLPGLYGLSSNCAFNCSHCIQGLCSSDNCSIGCDEGYIGYKSGCVRCSTSCDTCDSSSWENKKCLSCPNNKWGGLCEKTCPALCMDNQCNQDTGMCECSPGYYIEKDNSCSKCPRNCQTCESSTQCTLCANGTYGDICQHQCNKNCLHCENKSDQCTMCAAGQFLRDKTCYTCKNGCTQCSWVNESNAENCTSCSNGFYLDKSDDSPLLKCFKCSPGCSKCDINGHKGHCQSCTGDYFPYNNGCCPNNCTSCSVKTPHDCSRCWMTWCDDCKEGLHGNQCQDKCNDNCLTCRGPSSCITCRPGYYSISTFSHENYCECSTSQCAARGNKGSCIACQKEGWYPRKTDCCQCNNCKDLRCDASGNCLNGCVALQRIHKYGAKCDKQCNRVLDNCWNCTGLSEESVKCLSCVTDFHYVSDTGKCVYCPQHCSGSRCGPGGVCYSCEEGWAGDQCSIECGRRCNTTCEQTGCPECKGGYFGEFCQELCSLNCANNTNGVPLCYMNGVCHNCVNGYWGKHCNQSCSNGCHRSVCDRQDGQCTEGCVTGFYGNLCETRSRVGMISGLDCSRCLGGECIGTSHECAACPPGRWGYICERECSTTNCIDNTCSKSSGSCTCKPGYFGRAISMGFACLRCPENCIDCTSYGPISLAECQTCIDGKFSTKCELNCSPGCAKCVAVVHGSGVEKCLECLPGLYGVSSHCAFNCNNCIQGLCSNDACLLGCAEGYTLYESGCVRCFSTCDTCDSFSWKTNKCLSCPNNKWGNLCENTCSDLCIGNRCNQETGMCECDTGYYIKRDTSCSKCPQNCQACESRTQCTLCTTGTYGDTCQHQCNRKCLACKNKSDRCTMCPNGQYLRDEICYTCKEGCAECSWTNKSNTENCTSCSRGFYLDKVEGSPLLKCFQCSPGCLKCAINGQEGHCQRCTEGYFPYGRHCCPNNCTSCLVFPPRNCPKCWTTWCDGCREGFFGSQCQEKCSNNCHVPWTILYHVQAWTLQYK